ncbi:hypothetical protein ABPG75_004043 [Micractinium tetrahymenae]
MVARCRAAGVEVAVDAVMNHMASALGNAPTGRAGSPIGPGCRSFPGLYSCQDFHHNPGDCCSNCQVDTDFDLRVLQYCDIGLPDLATGSPYVQQQLASYLRQLADLCVTGIRVDSAKHIPAADLAAILGQAGRQLWVTHEITLWNPSMLDQSEYYSTGRVWEFKFPGIFQDAFKPDAPLSLLLWVWLDSRSHSYSTSSLPHLLADCSRRAPALSAWL